MSLESFVRNSASPRKTLMLVLVTTMVAAALGIPTVKADSITIKVSPNKAPVGATVTVSGVDATGGKEVRIYVVYYHEDVIEASVFVASTIANTAGGYQVDVTVPAVPSDTYSIMALDVTKGSIAITDLTVKPRIILTPTEGGCYSEVMVRGHGFQSYSDVFLYFDGDMITPSSPPYTDDLGSFEASYILDYSNIRPRGTYTVKAIDTWGYEASATFNAMPQIMVWPKASGGSSSYILVQGSGFAPSVNVTLHFDTVDVTPYGLFLTWPDGSFEAAFFVPKVADGTYTIKATDAAGNMGHAEFFVPSPILTLTPSRIFECSVVTARAVGFAPFERIMLRLQNITMTHTMDLMWNSKYLFANEDGSFEYSFIAPVTKPGVYRVVAYQTLEPLSQLNVSASAPLTIIDNSPIDVDADCGSMHFRGEMAEFWVKTACGGHLVDAEIDRAMLHYSAPGSTIDLTEKVERVATGVYIIPYAIPGDAPHGTYTLVVEASYYEDMVEAYGAASCGFLMSPTLTSTNAELIDVKDKIGTIVIPELGVIEADLAVINARVVSIEGTEATIQSDIGVLKADTETMSGDLGELSTDLGALSTDLDKVESNVGAAVLPINVAILIVALVAVVATLIVVWLVQSMRRKD